MQLRILYQDDFLVAVDKPAGCHVQPPEDPTIRVLNSRTCLGALKTQLNQYAHPIHRIDFSTTGVLIFALDRDTARAMNDLFQKREVRKTYYCVIRGWMNEELTLDRPLGSELDPEVKITALTRFKPIMKIELPVEIGRYKTARYTLVRAEPHTGRFHQIRRHLAGASHPIIGDSAYGDGIHNRFFRKELGIESLLLKSQTLEFQHPQTGENLFIESRWANKWHKLFNLFGACPYSNSTRTFQCKN